MLADADSLTETEGEETECLCFFWIDFVPAIWIELKGILIELAFEMIGDHLNWNLNTFFKRYFS